jgi:uncharacterized protein (TIGR03437 family)
MTKTLTLLLPALWIVAGAQADQISTSLSVNVTAALDLASGNVTVNGTANLTNIGTGTVKETLQTGQIITGGDSATLPLPIVLSGGTLNISLSVPGASLLGGGPITGSGTVTGGTGTYQGATGTFTSLSGSATGSLFQTATISFSGPGTVTLGGSGSGGTGTGGTGTGGGGTNTPTPTITAVLDAGSYTSNIAEGSIFVVKGTNLSNSGYTAFSFPLPTVSTNSDKASITFTPTAGGAGTQAYLIYTYNQSGTNQLAAILPSTVAAGNYNVTVTANGATSTPFAAAVVKNKVELFTQDASGSGLVLNQNVVSASEYDVDRFTTGTVAGITISPAHPGQTLVAYATGLGPVSGGDNVASPGYDFTKNGVTVAAVVGGVSIPALYAGRTPTLAGLDQINFTLPANVPTGCTVSFQISENGVLSAPTFLAIAPDASSSACVQPGFTTSQLQNFDQGGTVTSGDFEVSQLQESVPSVGTVKIDTAGGGFYKFSGFQLAALAQQQIQTSSSGACTVTHFSGSASQISSGGTLTGLDAGKITLNGPAGSGVTNLALTQDGSLGYSLSLGEEGLGVSIPGQPNVTLSPGTYTLTGSGGADVGPFTATVQLGSPLAVTGGIPATVVRSSGLTLNWTGGNASDVVEIVGYSGTTSGSGASQKIDATEFFCSAKAGDKTFTVPASILNQLPAATNTGTSAGFLEVISSTQPVSGNGLFTAPLTAGGSIGNALFLGSSGSGSLVSYQ